MANFSKDQNSWQFLTYLWILGHPVLLTHVFASWSQRKMLLMPYVISKRYFSSCALLIALAPTPSLNKHIPGFRTNMVCFLTLHCFLMLHISLDIKWLVFFFKSSYISIHKHFNYCNTQPLQYCKYCNSQVQQIVYHVIFLLKNFSHGFLCREHIALMNGLGECILLY